MSQSLIEAGNGLIRAIRTGSTGTAEAAIAVWNAAVEEAHLDGQEYDSFDDSVKVFDDAPNTPPVDDFVV